jgi:hypothetical protein
MLVVVVVAAAAELADARPNAEGIVEEDKGGERIVVVVVVAVAVAVVREASPATGGR